MTTGTRRKPARRCERDSDTAIATVLEPSQTVPVGMLQVSAIILGVYSRAGKVHVCFAPCKDVGYDDPDLRTQSPDGGAGGRKT